METLGKQLAARNKAKRSRSEASINRRISKDDKARQAASIEYLQEHGDELVAELTALAVAATAKRGKIIDRVSIERTEPNRDHLGAALIDTMVFVGDHFASEDMAVVLTVKDDCHEGLGGGTYIDATRFDAELEIRWGKDVEPRFIERHPQVDYNVTHIPRS